MDLSLWVTRNKASDSLYARVGLYDVELLYASYS